MISLVQPHPRPSMRRPPTLLTTMPSPATLIRHLHLPPVTPFHLVQELQSHLAHQLLSSKSQQQLLPSPPPAPHATILTFVPAPVYTTGRREQGTLSAEQRAMLEAPFTPIRRTSLHRRASAQRATVVPTLRGGQTTFHGPGQLVIYPILDLKPQSRTAPDGARTAAYGAWPDGISVRCYVNLLEQATIDTLRHWALKGVRTEHPGVWEESGERKIAALGVHLRRNVTSYGVGLNVATDLAWFDRIVACGLAGKGVVSMRKLFDETGARKAIGGGNRSARRGIGGEGAGAGAEGIQGKDGVTRRWLDTMQQKNGLKLSWSLKTGSVGRVWVREFARGLLGEGGEAQVKKVGIEDLGLDREFVMRFRIESEVENAKWRFSRFANGRTV